MLNKNLQVEESKPAFHSRSLPQEPRRSWWTCLLGSAELRDTSRAEGTFQTSRSAGWFRWRALWRVCHMRVGGNQASVFFCIFTDPKCKWPTDLSPKTTCVNELLTAVTHPTVHRLRQPPEPAQMVSLPQSQPRSVT